MKDQKIPSVVKELLMTLTVFRPYRESRPLFLVGGVSFPREILRLLRSTSWSSRVEKSFSLGYEILKLQFAHPFVLK